MTTVKIRPNIPRHLILVMGPTATDRVAFDILIQFLIRIQIRTVARKIKDLNTLFVLLEPLLRLRRHMNRMLVNNQKDISRNLAHQTSQKFNENLGSEPTLKDHKVKSSSEEETISDSVYEAYLGGKGLGTYLLMQENPPGVDALSPKNKLIFCLGPVTDSRIYGSCRHGVFTKSPLTGIYSESHSGGKVAEPMSRTGYDAFILEEASNDPAWVEISNEKITFHDAKDLWEKGTYFTEDEVLKRANKKGAAALVIGPAGENLVRYAAI